MIKIKNKKAQVFTLIAIALIGLMFVSFELFSVVKDRNVVKTRIETMESFLFSIEENLERQMFISGFRVIFLSLNEIVITGNYVSNFDDVFRDSFFEFPGAIDDPNGILNGVTYDDLETSLNEKAKKINVEIVLSNPVVSVSQEDPWNVKFVLTVDFTMQDKAGLATWEKQQVVTAYVPVEGFNDPVYTKETGAKVSQKITKTTYDEFNSVADLLDHVDNSYYAANSDAPSFLQRLEGDLTADVNGNGIESFVDTSYLSEQGVPITVKSTVDHIYFSASNPSNAGVTGMPSWFRIDVNHEGKYGL